MNTDTGAAAELIERAPAILRDLLAIAPAIVYALLALAIIRYGLVPLIQALRRK